MNKQLAKAERPTASRALTRTEQSISIRSTMTNSAHLNNQNSQNQKELKNLGTYIAGTLNFFVITKRSQ